MDITIDFKKCTSANDQLFSTNQRGENGKKNETKSKVISRRFMTMKSLQTST